MASKKFKFDILIQLVYLFIVIKRQKLAMFQNHKDTSTTTHWVS